MSIAAENQPSIASAPNRAQGAGIACAVHRRTIQSTAFARSDCATRGAGLRRPQIERRDPGRAGARSDVRSRGSSGVDRRTDERRPRRRRPGDERRVVVDRRAEQRQFRRRRARRERRPDAARRLPERRPNSASKPDEARRAVPASINARSSRPSTESASRRIGNSGSAAAGDSEKSYPQLRHRSALSNPR